VFDEGARAEIVALVDRALRTGELTLGSCTLDFEALVQNRLQVAHAVAVASGTAALEIALRAAGVEGREVIVPANTFYATAAAVVHAGGRVRFADVAADTFALSGETVAAAMTPHVAGVVHVHIGGFVSPEVPAIAEWCRSQGVFFLEDAARAHGSSLAGRPAGTFGDAGAFSIYPTKVITSGEGGMLVTDDAALAQEARLYRDQGKAGFLGGEHVRLGYAWRMSELHAAVGAVQWRRLDDFLRVRRRVAASYDQGLADFELVRPLGPPPNSEGNYYKYPVRLPATVDRDALKDELRERHGVSLSGEVYARALHQEPVFADVDHVPLPVAEEICADHVCLPVHSDMTEAEATRVIEAFRAVVSRMAAPGRGRTSVSAPRA